MFDNWFPDLLLNLVAEAVGIIATVYFIERRLKEREEAKWLPSKHFLYSRLISHFDEVLWTTVPFLMSGTKYIYEFGDAVATTLEPNIDFSNPETTKELCSKLNVHFGKVSLEQKIVICKRLSHEKDEIDKVLASSIALIEPPFSSNLTKLQRVLSDADGYAGTLHLDGKLPITGFENAEISAFMYTVADAAQKAKTWVVSKATSRRRTEEFILELVDMANKKEGFRSKNG